jgi:hypothetical protein
MRDELAKSSLQVMGARGLPVAHPLLAELARHEHLLRRLLAGLGLEDADADPLAVSAAARRLGLRRQGNL